jgi:catechol 2,3-dioxygenase-like lactoylglutathione lyase family enzyme
MPKPSPIKGLYHFAYPCTDAEETRAFYEDLLGMPLVHVTTEDRVPSTGEEGPFAHLFFQMADNSYLAFFDLGKGERPQPSPNTPAWVQHFAMEVDSLDKVLDYKRRLEAAGVKVLGLVDHVYVQSIYFFDPNGLRLEINTRTEPEGLIERAENEAHARLAEWTRAKAERLAGGVR